MREPKRILMNGHNIRPAAVFHKGLAVFNAIGAGATSIAAIREATGFPPSTIVRVLSVLVHEDNIVEAHMVDEVLHLFPKMRCNPDDLH